MSPRDCEPTGTQSGSSRCSPGFAFSPVYPRARDVKIRAGRLPINGKSPPGRVWAPGQLCRKDTSNLNPLKSLKNSPSVCQLPSGGYLCLTGATIFFKLLLVNYQKAPAIVYPNKPVYIFSPLVFTTQKFLRLFILLIIPLDRSDSSYCARSKYNTSPGQGCRHFTKLRACWIHPEHSLVGNSVIETIHNSPIKHCSKHCPRLILRL